MEKLLDDLKDTEVSDARQATTFDQLAHDAVPGGRYCLELVDEISDINSNLNEYVEGNALAGTPFLENVEDFESFFDHLIPLEQRPEELESLDTVENLSSR